MFYTIELFVVSATVIVALLDNALWLIYVKTSPFVILILESIVLLDCRAFFRLLWARVHSRPIVGSTRGIVNDWAVEVLPDGIDKVFKSVEKSVTSTWFIEPPAPQVVSDLKGPV